MPDDHARARLRAVLRRLAPHGSRDLVAQIALWTAFGLCYEAVRGTAGRDRDRALADGRSLIRLERHLHTFFEPSLQRGLSAASSLETVLKASYWLAEFTMLVLALVFTYYRRRDVYGPFRDSVLVTNVLGLVGYVAYPTAPPRLFPDAGFRNALSGQPSALHPTGLISFAANPYAAMPSLHVADAILVGFFLARGSRSPLGRAACALWPCWVTYVVTATGNHFWLDAAAGGVAAAAGLLLAPRIGSVVHRRAGQ